MNTKERVRQIIIEQTGIEAEQVTDHALLIDDLGLDWLDIVQLAMACEEQFGVEVPDDVRLDTVLDLADHVERQLAVTA